MKINTLYLCYFGLREPLVQTQVLPYLREVNKLEGLKVSMLTFESDFKRKWTAEQIEVEKAKLTEESISWYCLPYHKSPSAPATAFDVLNGVRFAIGLSRKEKINVFHARAHIPMLMAMLASRVTKSKIIFDIRGLMAEEYADAGIWQKNSKPFRFIKYIEKKGIEKATQIVVLTNRMREYLVENNLKDRAAIEVIPCCVDFSRIENAVPRKQENNRFELVYAGSVTGLYLLREMCLFFLELKKVKEDAFFRVLTSASPQVVQKVFRELGILENDYAISKVSADEVPSYLKQANLGISFRSPTFSQIAASPTKIPEYLACGLPVVSNYGIGDTDLLFKEERIGVCLKTFDSDEMRKAVEEILKTLNGSKTAEECIRISHKYFDLAIAGRTKYQNVYLKLIQ